MTIQCCDCKRLRVDGTWTAPSPDFAGPVSHSYCPACAEAFLVGTFAETASRSKVRSIRYAETAIAEAASA
jgi:hypothetical protein